MPQWMDAHANLELIFTPDAEHWEYTSLRPPRLGLCLLSDML